MNDRALLLASAALLAACNGGAGGPVAFGDYCTRYVDITCRAAEACDCLGTYSMDMCRLAMRMDCEDEVERPVSEGLMSYDAETAGRCLGDLKTVLGDCSLEGDDYPEACDSFLEGTVEAGQLCEDEEVCRPGLDCHNDLCTDLPGQGEGCLDGYVCESDLYCGGDSLCHRYKSRGEGCETESWTCDDDLYCDSRSWTCEPYLGAGESCSHNSSACDDDLYCSSSTQTCLPYPASGESCAETYQCAEGFYCDADTVCREQKEGGEPCVDYDECLSGDCVDGLCEEGAMEGCPFL